MEFAEKIVLPYIPEILCKPSNIYLVSSVVICLAIIVAYYATRDNGVPPGPTGVPLLGYWPFMKNKVNHDLLLKMKKKYGDIFSIRVGGKLFIHLASYKVAKEAVITKANCFPEKTTDYSVLGTALGNSFSFSNRNKWQSLRKFFVNQLKERGITYYKENTAEAMNDNINTLINQIKSHSAEPLNIFCILTSKVKNVVLHTLFGPDTTISESDIQTFMSLYHPFTSMLRNFENMYLIGNIAKYFIVPFSKRILNGLKSNRNTRDFFLNIIEDHKKTFKKGNIRDIIDNYIHERNIRKSKLDPTAEFFTDETLAVSLRQFLGDSIINVSFVTVRLLMKLAEHQDIQERIYNELLEVCGEDRNPSMVDKSKLSYTNAVLQEFIRVTANAFLLFQSTECKKETTIGGYRIPKGAALIVDLFSIHGDPQIYENPEKFVPTRFLEKTNKNKPETLFYFGIGKHLCLGEGFVIMQLFLYCTAIVKNFHILFAQKNIIDPPSEALINFQLKFTPRK